MASWMAIGNRIRPVSCERKDGGLLFNFSDGSSTFYPDLANFYGNSFVGTDDEGASEKDDTEAT
jgi:hypothetical protein